MTVVVNNKVHIMDNYKQPTDIKFDDCTSDILKNLAAEDSSDNESNAVPKISDGQNQTKAPKHEAETCWNNSNKTTA